MNFVSLLLTVLFFAPYGAYIYDVQTEGSGSLEICDVSEDAFVFKQWVFVFADGRGHKIGCFLPTSKILVHVNPYGI